MTATVTRLGQKNEPGKAEVVAMLHEAISRVENGEDFQYKRAVLLLLDKEDDTYNVGFMNAGLSMSECISLTEVAKTQFLNEMCYIPDPCVCDG